MLTGWLRRGVLVLCSVVLFLVSGQAAAMAGGGPGGGDPFGSVQCGQSFSPSCTVTAGGGGTHTVATGPSGPAGCAGTMNPQFGCVPAGCQISVNVLACPFGIGGPGGPPAPGVLAQLAVRLLRIPAPVIRSSPAAGILQLTEFPTWLWVSRDIWVPVSQTAAVPGERVTATATPVAVSWQMGDGRTAVCRGPGTPYSSRWNPRSPSPDCGYTYQTSSAGQPGSAFPVTVTITWNITWIATGGAGGALPPLFSAAAGQFRVAESQARNTATGSAL